MALLFKFMGSPSGLPITSFQLSLDHLEEVGRLYPKANKEVKAKKSNLRSLLHMGWSLRWSFL
jgi:hypothetical protein